MPPSPPCPSCSSRRPPGRTWTRRRSRSASPRPTIPAFQGLHLHQIGLPLLVDAEHQDRQRRKSTTDGTMQRVVQLPLQFFTRFIWRQTLCSDIAIQAYQRPGHQWIRVHSHESHETAAVTVRFRFGILARGANVPRASKYVVFQASLRRGHTLSRLCVSCNHVTYTACRPSTPLATHLRRRRWDPYLELVVSSVPGGRTTPPTHQLATNPQHGRCAVSRIPTTCPRGRVGDVSTHTNGLSF